MPATLSDLLLSVRMEHARFAVLTLHEDAHVILPPTNQFVAHLVLAGGLELKADSGPGVRANRHDFLVYPRGDSHALKAERPAPAKEFKGLRTLKRDDAPAHFNVGKKPSVAAILLSAVFGLERYQHQRTHSRLPALMHLKGGDLTLPAVAGEGRSLAEHCTGPGGSAFAAALTYLLFIQAVRTAFATAEVDVATYGRRASDGNPVQVPALEAVLRFLDRHPDATWTVAAMASAVGMSRSAFAAGFREFTGVTPLAHLTELRLREAARLLGEAPELTIGEIALRTGYQSQAAFSRAYRRRYGVAPRQSR